MARRRSLGAVGSPSTEGLDAGQGGRGLAGVTLRAARAASRGPLLAAARAQRLRRASQ